MRSSVKRKVWNRANDCCEYCGSDVDLQIHHVIPLHDFGPENELENLLGLCGDCHRYMHLYEYTADFDGVYRDPRWRGVMHGGFGTETDWEYFMRLHPSSYTLHDYREQLYDTGVENAFYDVFSVDGLRDRGVEDGEWWPTFLNSTNVHHPDITSRPPPTGPDQFDVLYGPHY